jgi:hypothetical protein
MKAYATYLLKKIATILEFVISLMLAIGIIILCARMAASLINVADFDTWPNYDDLLATCFNLIIGVELIRMMIHHTPHTVFEVLLFAIARQIIMDHSSMIGSVLGIVCIAGLFATRKYLFSEFDISDRTIIRPTIKITTLNRMLHLHFPVDKGNTVGELFTNIANYEEITIAVGAIIEFPNAALSVAKMKDGKISRLEVIRAVH